MYQIPVRRSPLDRDYVIYAGYRVETEEPSARIIRTDAGVDFSEDRPRRRAYHHGGIPLVKPRPDANNFNQQHGKSMFSSVLSTPNLT